MKWWPWLFSAIFFLLGAYPLLSIPFQTLPLRWGVRGRRLGDGAPMSIASKVIAGSTCWLWAASLVSTNETFQWIAFRMLAILFLAVIVVGGLDQIRYEDQQKAPRDPGD